jgi:hypothetical protein
MQNIDWTIYRHPELLQALDMTIYERKYLNLFLKRNKINNIGNLNEMPQTRLILVRDGVKSSKNMSKEKVSMNI